MTHFSPSAAVSGRNKFSSGFKFLGILLLVLMVSGKMVGQISITSTGTAYLQNFDGMNSTGTSTPTNWYVGSGSAAATVNIAISGTIVVAGTGSANGGNVYNYGVAATNVVGERALGSLASGGNSRLIEARFINNTGASISSITINYDGEQWRLGVASGSAETGYKLYYSTDGTNFTAMGSGFNFTPPIMSGTAGALDGNASANRVANIGGLYTPASAIANGTTFYLRWLDTDDSGTD